VRFFLPLGFLLTFAAVGAAEPTPLVQAHAHNDYEHARPLFDALDRGFCSVEADVYLVDGELLVSHDRKDVQPGRTLARLYLQPLQERVRGSGRVYREGPPLVLLVDIKSEAAPTYAALHLELEKFASMLTTFRASGSTPGAVTVIISGNRPVAEMSAQSVRYAAIDGRREDLDRNPPATLVPLVSDNWKKHFTWDWQGEMPAKDRAALQQWVERAHAQGRRVRFWNTPDQPAAWEILLAAGVDVIGTDDLEGLARFLKMRPQPKAAR
jgi:hypothetical protein